MIAWNDILALFFVLFLPLIVAHYLLIVKPAKKRVDIWLKQHENKDNEGKR